MPFNTIYHLRNVSPYIPLSVNTSTTLINHVFHNIDHFSFPRVCLSSLKCQLILVLSMFLRDRYIQFLLRFCLIRFLLLSQQKLF